jgi:hypothetical protein
MIPKTTQSKTLLKITQLVPGIIDKKTIQKLITDPKRNLFSYEDGVEALNSAELSAGEKTAIDKKVDNLHEDLFPNVKLAAELEVARDIDRMLYDEFEDQIIVLNDISKRIDEKFGNDVDFLLDEIKQDGNVEDVNAIKNMNVTIIDIEKRGSEDFDPQKLLEAKRKKAALKAKKGGKKPVKKAKKGKEDDDDGEEYDNDESEE